MGAPARVPESGKQVAKHREAPYMPVVLGRRNGGLQKDADRFGHHCLSLQIELPEGSAPLPRSAQVDRSGRGDRLSGRYVDDLDLLHAWTDRVLEVASGGF